MARTVIPIGPYHPLQEEPEFFKLIVEGEKVLDIEINLGYNHRGIEQLCEQKHYDQLAYVVERICGICSTSHPFAHVNCVEDLLGIQIPERALYIRTIIGELERLHSHLLWLGLAGHFIGYNTVWMWAWKHREIVLDIFEKISGNRQNYAMMKIGGVRRDIDDADIPWVKAKLNELVPALKLFKGAVEDDPVIHARTKGVGILPKDKAREYCVVGPTARASGINIDIRRDEPYAAYDKVDWKVVVFESCDVYAKAMVRIMEMFESFNIVMQCLDKLPKGEIDAKVAEIPPGEGIGRHEAPRGEVFHYVRSDGTNRPARYKVRAPSYVNIASNKIVAVGQTISDAALTLAAVDPCYCCTERMAAVNTKGKLVYTADDLIKMSQEKTRKLREKYRR